MREICRSLVVLVFVASFLGCGSGQGPTGEISGKLTMDGKPLPAGHAVSFMQMQAGFLAYGITDAEGNFQVKSAYNGKMPIGSYDVMIAPPGGEGDTSTVSAEDRFEQGQANGKSKTAFPARYRETTKSGLKYDIKEGKNHFNIDIKSK